jgi:hypothetical protein
MKCWTISAILHSATSQKTDIFSSIRSHTFCACMLLDHGKYTVRSTSSYHVFQTFSSFIIIIPIIIVAVNFQRVVL